MQPRFLIITDKYLYNVKPPSLFGGLVAKFKPEKRIKRLVINRYFVLEKSH